MYVPEVPVSRVQDPEEAISHFYELVSNTHFIYFALLVTWMSFSKTFFFH